MVNIVKFAQFYCIYLLSSAQMSAEEKQIRCFYKKQSILWPSCPIWSEFCILHTFAGGIQMPCIPRIIS